MKIRLANIDDRDKWDEYITHHANASPYHLFAWKTAVENAYKHKGYYLMAEENLKIQGVLPLIFMKPPFRLGQLVSLPFCDLGGVLSNCTETEHKLVKESTVLARKLKAKQIELRCHTPTPSSQVKDLSVSTQSHKVSMLLELSSTSDQLIDNFKSKLRSQIRKSEKNGLKFIFGSLEEIDDFYLIFCRNMRELGSPVHSKKWFKCIIQHYGDCARLGLVYYGSKPIGGGIILSKGNKVCASWASTLRNYNRLSPNMLLYWNFLKYSADNGYRWFDFGRSTPEEGTYKFKLQWGAKPEPLYWDNISVNGKQQRSDTKTSSNRKLAEQIWQRLPLSLANYIGPSIRKHISL
ncbi:MAG: FemAB family XrtA/PEP-CTERM system-associated protein [Planctomycetota bacterium]|jgi:FemAB-related protein (PEP-CTERM system-associated)